MSELYFLDFLSKLAIASTVTLMLSVFFLGFWFFGYEITTYANEKEKQGYMFVLKIICIVILVSSVICLIVPSHDLINYEIKQIKERDKK